MSRPLLLDLFCGEGGAATGYHEAGFDIVGVDIDGVALERYPFDALCTDVVGLLSDAIYTPGRFMIGDRPVDAIHASPPCQAYSFATINHRSTNEYPDLVDVVRQLLVKIDVEHSHLNGIPWVIENVPGAPLVKPGEMTFDGRESILLCGSMFGMRRVRRHRVFESNVELHPPGGCRHDEQSDVMSIVGHSEQGRTLRALGDDYNPAEWGVAARREAMGMPWASRDGMSEAVPPIYTRWVGSHLMRSVLS